jgi:hypothetical protein
MNERKELIARLRLDYTASKLALSLMQQAADMLEADAQAVPQEPVAYLAWRDGKPCWEGDDCVCQDAVYPVDHDDDRTSMPVYLSPQPQRPLLTEDEIFEALDADTDDIAAAKNDQESWGVILTMARAIEKKVRGEE